jgi:FolB domain-containing protein
VDQITIKDLTVFYRVGVPDEERAKPQRLLLTIELEHDFTAAARHDDLTQTIDYHALTQRLQSYGRRRSWKLIEKLAVDLAVLILRDYGPQQVTVEVKKLILPETRYVSVKVTRPIEAARSTIESG